MGPSLTCLQVATPLPLSHPTKAAARAGPSLAACHVTNCLFVRTTPVCAASARPNVYAHRVAEVTQIESLLTFLKVATPLSHPVKAVPRLVSPLP